MLGLAVLVVPLPEVSAELVFLRDQVSAAMALMLACVVTDLSIS